MSISTKCWESMLFSQSISAHTELILSIYNQKQIPKKWNLISET